jgi:pimeloyl-ACP methyl ester carboxylesterase
MLRLLIALLMTLHAALGAAPAAAQDLAREKRWADEVVPGIVVGEAVMLKLPDGHQFLGLHAAGTPRKPALVLVHGIGVHPDHGVIGQLRMRLNDAGFTTLSIQMPVLDKDKRAGDYYPALFADAQERIATAARWLTERGHAHLVLVSHSLGSWMSNVYLDRAASHPFEAWVNIGLTGGFQTRFLGIDWPWLALRLPILDLYGEKDLVQSLEAAPRRARAIAGNPASRQLMIPGADHFHTGKEAELAAAIADFIDKLPGR